MGGNITANQMSEPKNNIAFIPKLNTQTLTESMLPCG